MTKLKHAAMARLVLTLFVLAAILLMPAAAFADSGSTDTVESSADEGSGHSDYSANSSGADLGTANTGETTGKITGVSSEPTPDSDPAPAGDPATNTPPQDPSTGLNDDPATDTPSETHAMETEAAVEEDAAAESGGSEGSAPGGNSYIATITPDAIVIEDVSLNPAPVGYEGPIAGDTCEFNITFTEVGNNELAAAMVQINEYFTENDSLEAKDFEVYITVSDTTKSWDYLIQKVDSFGWVIKLFADSPADYLVKGEEVSVTFSATTPEMWGVYEFTTWAWTEVPGGFSDVSFSPVALAHNSIINSMAAGYSNPVVIVGESISTADELADVRLDGYYVQTAHIDLGVAPYNVGPGWTPIGDFSTPFTGAYNGNGFTISNLTITDGYEYLGLFGAVSGDAVIMNVTLGDINITCEGEGNVNDIGGLVGFNEGTIINCAATGAVTVIAVGEVNTVGGLVGFNPGTIIECSATVAVTVTSNTIVQSVGGLVGYSYGTITNCDAESAVTVTSSGDDVYNVGGLAGANSGLITGCSSTGVVTVTSNTVVYAVGGLVGENIDTITDCYAAGAVTVIAVVDARDVGGLVGYNYGTITNCDAVSAVTVTSSGGNVDNIGGLVGYNEGTITNCYAAGVVNITVTSTDGNVNNVGGLVGYNKGAIANCYATGNVTVTSVTTILCVGGLVGYNYGTITNCYAVGAVNVAVTSTGGTINCVGGLVGYNNGDINNSYAAGVVKVAVTSADSYVDYVGGLVGFNEVTISGCGAVPYSGLLIGNQDNPDPNVHTVVRAITAADMKKIGTFAGWDIVLIGNFNPDAVPGDDDFYTWYIDEGNDYPRLWWQYEGREDDPTDTPGDPGGPGFTDVTRFMSPFNFPVPGSLVLANGSQPFITADFVRTGTAADLARAFSLYFKLLEAFEKNRDKMTPGEYARAMVELTTAWAAIMALEARLLNEAGVNYDPAPLISAYEAALATFSAYRGYLNEAEVGAVQAVLNAVAEVIRALGLTV